MMNWIALLVAQSQKNDPSNPSSDFVPSFWLETQNLKQIYEDEIYLDLPTFLSSKFLEKNYSTMPTWGLKFYIKYNSWIWLISVWVVELLLILIYISHMVCFNSHHSTCVKRLHVQLHTLMFTNECMVISWKFQCFFIFSSLILLILPWVATIPM